MNRFAHNIFWAPEPATPAAPAAPATPAVAQPPATPPAAPAVPATVLTGDPAAPPAAPVVPAVPEEISIKFPEGVQFDKPYLDKFTALAKEAGLKSDGAQKLADFYVEMQKDLGEKQVETITKWAEDAKADKEIGGANFDQNLSVAKKALDRVATPALRELLATSGLGNHVEVIRLFANIGKSISEDRLPGGDPTKQGEPSLEQQVKEAFPNSPTMKI
jgi:hypothetical protein